MRLPRSADTGEKQTIGNYLLTQVMLARYEAGEHGTIRRLLSIA
jgi:hypothetical protein